jgi:hypothetical protein
VPGFYKRAKELADQCWAAESEWQAMHIVCDNYDLFVLHRACFIPREPLHNLADWAREVFDPPTRDDNIDFYSEGWVPARRQALEEADEICEQCGMSQKQHRRTWEVGLHVHHKQPVRLHDDPSDAHTPNNLEVLCIDCHADVHAGD